MITKNVSVVVPVYGDWPSLNQCIKSLKKYVTNDNKVIFVNDCGPDVDVIEKNILKDITGLTNFEYHRNGSNLGFVKTCNRAAFEIDQTDNDILLLNSDTIVTEGFLKEMTGVLYLDDKHGVVCPRSSNATIASVPFKFLQPKDERTPEYAYRVYEQIKDQLPRYSVTPVAVGFCMLIKRNLIKNFGLFDEMYGLGYSEENDFCLRINKYGYSSVMANHAFVYHLESMSFTSDKKKLLVDGNEAKMIKRYPFYKELVQRYINQFIDPIDWFADAIADTNERVKILVDLYHLPLSFNGTSRNALSFLSYIEKKIDRTKYDITILSQKDAKEYHSLDSFGFRVIYPGDIDEIFHIGYSPSQIFHYDNLKILNKYCLKIVVSDLDIIGIRCNKLLAADFSLRSIFLDSFRFSDKIISISDFTTHDTLAYFSSELDEDAAKKFITIHQGYPGKTFEHTDANYGADAHKLPEEVLKKGGYVLVMGNDYPHKVVNEVIQQLKDTNDPLVVLGASKFKNSELAYTLPSGGISDAYMEKIIKACSVMLFPSQYEGFGLPIAEAAFYGKPIVLADNAISREVSEIYKEHISPFFFDTFDQIPLLLQKVKATKHVAAVKASHNIRLLDDYNSDIFTLLENVAKEPVNTALLRHRWQYFNQMNEYASVDSARALLKLRIRTLNYLRKTSPTLHSNLRDLYRSYIKH